MILKSEKINAEQFLDSCTTDLMCAAKGLEAAPPHAIGNNTADCIETDLFTVVSRLFFCSYSWFPYNSFQHTEEKTAKHRERLSLRERAQILRLADEKRPEVIVQSQESYCILLVKSFFVDRSCRTAKLRRNLKLLKAR